MPSSLQDIGRTIQGLWPSLPAFGTTVLYAILVAAAYTFAVSVAAGLGRPRLLHSARFGAYGTIALVGLAVLILAYAFVSHDFRLSYVRRYSERAMSTPYLLAALWGGQDGSLLWWLFLTSMFSGVCIKWLGRRYLALQPYVIATLMSIVLFFSIIMIFAVSPFATNVGGAPVDGNGLNFQLRNFYMIIHPPSLYLGFTSATIPFAFAMAALITGRLDAEWLIATRKWTLFSWLFLSIGNALGMLWAYEELGWGGYWAWDPVENAAFLPWFTTGAFVHSIMIQERRGMLKVWNVFLICATFFLTIFGTFLTRSGLIKSVHSFANSNIGIFFVWYMGFIAAVCIALIVYRLPMLRSEGRYEAFLSRETAFVLNNWGLVSMCVFIAVATIWPRISEWLLGQESTLGPTFYNTWLPPLALLIFALMGIAPLLGWRKTSPELFKRSFIFPVGVGLVVGVLHVAFGARLNMPAFVKAAPIYTGLMGDTLAWIIGKLPLVTTMLAGFNVAVVVQEFKRGIDARQRAAAAKNQTEAFFKSLVELVARSKRRYGGYVVHVGIVVMFLGFTGKAWGVDMEVSLVPGQEATVYKYAEPPPKDPSALDRAHHAIFGADPKVEAYTVRYEGTRRVPDPEKTALIADMTVLKNGEVIGKIMPSKFIYKNMPEPSTEIAKYMTLENDLYVTLGMANPETKRAAFQIHINPMVNFIWIGVGILILGALIAMWPELEEQEANVFTYLRAAASVGTSVMMALLLAVGPSYAFGHNEHTSRDGPTLSEGAGSWSVNELRTQ